VLIYLLLRAKTIVFVRFTSMNFNKILLLNITLLFGACLHAQSVQIISQSTPTEASLRGLSAVNEQIVWASGSQGTVLKTFDGGTTWNDVSVPKADSLDFRDIEAFSALKAIVISAGSPAKIYVTEDGGTSWTETYSNIHPQIFFDAMSFWDYKNGIAFSDAINGHLVIITTNNGGYSWNGIEYSSLPESPDGEGGFAASGTCLTTFGKSTVWIGLGSPASRVFKSTDKGKTWTVVETPMKRPKPTGGIFSLDFSSANYGIAVGGDYEDDTNNIQNAAITLDGGATWNVLQENKPNGYRSVVANVPGTKWWIAAGTSGVDLSLDNGKTWKYLSKKGFHSASFGSSKIGWLCGSKGIIAKIIIE